MHEELLKQILDEMKDLKKRIITIESNMATKEDLDKMEARIAGMETKFEERMDSMEEKLDLVAEQTAKITTEIHEVKEDIRFLVHKSGEHERDIYKLKYRHG